MHIPISLRMVRLCASLLLLLASVFAAQAQAAISIKGTPASSAIIYKAYSFTPTVSGGSGTIRYTITNRPSWAGFDAATGKLWGTPSSVATYQNISIRVSDNVSSATLPSFSIAVTKSGSTTTLKISGTPPGGVVGTAYSFRPTVSGSSGTIAYAITNKPSWASFSTTTGQISGTPTTATTYSNISIRATDSKTSATLGPVSIVVANSSTAALKISGTPAAGVVGTAYSFRPTVSGASGTVAYAITNKPSWASFSTTTGQISGTPTAAGTFSNISIRATDSKTSATLGPLAITVAKSGTTTASLTVSWSPPTTNSNGTTLSNLAGYRIYYGTSASSLTQTVQITNPGLTRYVIDGLKASTWYFSMTSVNSAGAESARTAVVSKSIQ